MQTLDTSPIIETDLQVTPTSLEQVIDRYETLIDRGNTDNDNYWYLGLAYLLQERELDAQATWFIPFEAASELESEVLTSELSALLDRSATEEFYANNLDNARSICEQLQSIDPFCINNLLRSILIKIKFEEFIPDLLIEWQVNELVIDSNSGRVDRNLLADLLRSLLDFPAESTSRSIEALIVTYLRESVVEVDNFASDIMNAAHRTGANTFMVDILEFCRTLQPQNFQIAHILGRVYSDMACHDRAIETCASIYDLCDSTCDRIRASYPLLIAYLTAGNWQQANLALQRHQQLIEQFSTETFSQLDLVTNQRIIVANVFSPYTEDRPADYRQLQNKIAEIYLQHNQAHLKNYIAEPTSLQKIAGVIRIGYVGSTLKNHSVGWLSRWLFQHHDREKFQVFTYCINQNPDNPFYQKWFRDRSNVSYCMVADGERVAAQIRADEIDILIDLDSLTLNITCQVLAAKPAPVQVSWLGWDATGLSTVDYFIADPYVLPANAQDYYREKIWRLPQTYLAVNGFEVGIATLSRRDLNIPDDAIVYWSGQRGFKRHPQTVRAQMRIIKAVPNSYFIVKGDTDPKIIQEFFGQIAIEEGVEFDRLRFVGSVADEPTHRANLAIADIVLDTFPYNGATTTLETLWMGIPMVTQVGKQFAARNSYTFMLNAGIEEGIAWSEAEYIEWGIKLGLDRDLRDKIAGKLRSGRTTAPVWNAKQFTLDLEQAFQEMWAKYQEQNQYQASTDYSNN
ncbi:O-linked N-acetylglucosamine transferase, SPINDLY family protein [Chamaesiphon sp. GL140_3_metabinner_50]|uniref:O-linked N-acetylglucosamine transferase, SPINDLY family protein n=1 Tax=Chamaesiphon sp. GL140_3_metabinner_50 TaxID=2970812 RepID=UPI0025D954C7|nr:O-linked N-acetylglucosamine transferase, SPINDLY family protein [Chamaesiphon sp. GL140_3_metabinner_50]